MTSRVAGQLYGSSPAFPVAGGRTASDPPWGDAAAEGLPRPPALQAENDAGSGSLRSWVLLRRTILSPLTSTSRLTIKRRAPQLRMTSEVCSPRARAVVGDV